jgi:hypothetical protein
MRNQLYVYGGSNKWLYATVLTHIAPDLSAPVDVYSEWVDAAGTLTKMRNTFTQFPITDTKADAVAKEDVGGRGEGPTPATRQSARPSASDRYGDGDDGDQRYEGEGVIADDEEY